MAGRCEGTAESVAAITADDCAQFIGARLAKDNLMVGVAGDVTAEELGRAARSRLRRPAGDQRADRARADAAPRGGGTIVVRKDVPAEPGAVRPGRACARDDPDYYAAYVANHILGGGGFTSRLTEEVREKRGLAYSVYSYLYPMDHAPLWLGGVGTANAAVDESIRLVRAGARAHGRGRGRRRGRSPTPRPISPARFPLRLTSNDQIASMLVSMQVDDLGIDYLERRNGYIEAVTLEDVRRVAARLYHPDELLVVVVGDPTGLEG